MGTTSVQFMNDRYVFKSGRYPLPNVPLEVASSMVDRDACFLQKMREGFVPRVLCADHGSMLTENAGRLLTVHNIPQDYRVQAKAILADMASRGIAHHDIYKFDSSSAFMLEMLVDSAGKLRLVDFGTGTVNGSFQCDSHRQVPNKRSSTFFSLVQDNSILTILDSMYAANRSLGSYRSAGISAQVGVCKHSDVVQLLDNTSGLSSRRGRFVASFTLQQLQVSNHETTFYDDGKPAVQLIHPGHLMPPLVDVQACVQHCRLQANCTYVSVSSSRQACLWFSTSACEFHAHVGLFSLSLERNTFVNGSATVNRKGLGLVLKWFDDFVTVDVHSSGAHEHGRVPESPTRI